MTGFYPQGPKPVREPKERKRVSRQSKQGRLEHRAELACSLLADIRAGGLCEFCGNPGNQTQHGYGKGAHPNVRFCGLNLFWSCDPCHRRGERYRSWLLAKMLQILLPLDDSRLWKALRGPMDDPKDVIAAAKQGRFLVSRA